jgi:uracil-DNA glycosylase
MLYYLMTELLNQVRSCMVCQEQLLHVPRPIIQFSPHAKIAIVGQAPGRRVHETGIPWNDASGRKLREWLSVADEEFYNPNLFAILPMAFCYPGKGKSGDLPPMPQCSKLWHSRFFNEFTSPPLILLIGQYAQRYYLKETFKGSLTDTVKAFDAYLPAYFPLPHPSPRNQNWVKINPWFSAEVIPYLRVAVRDVLIKDK